MILFNLYKRISATQFSFLAYAAQLGFGFLSFLTLIRKCNTEIFGWWVLYISLSSIADLARTGLVQNGLIRMSKANPTKAKEIRGAAFGLIMPTSLILSFIVLVALMFYGFNDAIGKKDFLRFGLFFGVLFLLQAYLRVRESDFMAKMRFDLLFWSKLVYGSSFFTGIVLWDYPNVLQLIQIQFIAILLSFLFMLFQPGRPMKWNYPIAQDLFRYGRFVMGTNLGSMIYNKMDVLILGSLLGPSAVAIYNAASRITNFVEVPLSSKAQVVFPELSKYASQNKWESLARHYELGLGQVLLLLTPLCLLVAFLAKPLILLIAGEDYLLGVPVLQVLSFSVLLKPWGRFFGITMDAINRPNTNFYFLLGWILFNAFLNFLLVPYLGVMGVAVATLISVAGNAVLGQWVLKQFLPIKPINTLTAGVKYFFNHYKSKSLWT